MSTVKRCDHPKRKIDVNLTKVVDSLNKLKKVNVSYHLVVHMEGTSQSFGTPSASKVFQEHKEEFDGALIEDAVDMCATAASDRRVEKNRTKDMTKEKAYELKNGKELRKLPFPLSLMNRKEKIAYLRYLIPYDRMERLGIDAVGIIAGEPTWEPTFWPNEIVKWSDLKVNLALIKSEHLNGESPTVFMAKVLSAAFQMLNLDPEKYVDEKATNEMLKKRKRLMGQHELPAVHQAEARSPEHLSVSGDGVEEEYVFPPGVDTNFPEPQDSDSDANPTSTAVGGRLDQTRPEPANVSQPEHGVSAHKDGDKLDLPDYLHNILPGKQQMYNSGKGLCLSVSVSQKGNFDPIELKKYTNDRLIEWYVHLEKYFGYPFQVTIGTGNSSYQKTISNKYLFFKFLSSEESIYAFNTGQAEIQVLATILNQPIHILLYQIQGFPPGTPLIKRCRIDTISPIEFLKKDSKYVIEEDFYLLYEDDVHYSLLVDRDDVPVYEELTPVQGQRLRPVDLPCMPSQQHDPEEHPPMYGQGLGPEDHPHVNSKGLGSEENSTAHGHGLGVNSEEHPFVNDQRLGPTVMNDQELNYQEFNDPEFLDRLYNSFFPDENIGMNFNYVNNQNLPENMAQSVGMNDFGANERDGEANSEEEFAENLNLTATISTPIRPEEMHQTAHNSQFSSQSDSENLSVRRSKRILEKQTTIDRLMQIPSKSERERERQYSILEEERIKRKRKHEAEMAKLDANEIKRKKQQEMHDRETLQLIQLAEVLRTELTEEILQKYLLTT